MEVVMTTTNCRNPDLPRVRGCGMGAEVLGLRERVGKPSCPGVLCNHGYYVE